MLLLWLGIKKNNIVNDYNIGCWLPLVQIWLMLFCTQWRQQATTGLLTKNIDTFVSGTFEQYTMRPIEFQKARSDDHYIFGPDSHCTKGKEFNYLCFGKYMLHQGHSGFKRRVNSAHGFNGDPVRISKIAIWSKTCGTESPVGCLNSVELTLLL